jgi:hypothetical protein
MGEEELERENERLRELVVRLARALCASGGSCACECLEEFGCNAGRDCFVQDTLEELGIIQDSLDELV